MWKESLKNKLVKKLKKIDDPATLQEITNLFELQEPDSIYHTNNAQKQAIAKAKKQIEENQTLPDKQANREIDKWLKKINGWSKY